MDKPSLKENNLLNVGYQLVVMLTPLVTLPYVSRVLGPDGIGQYSFADSVVSYFVLFAVLGTGLFGQRETSFLQDSPAKRSEKFWNVALLRIITTLVCLAAFIPVAIIQSQHALYFALAINIVAVAFDFTWFFQGMENFRAIVLRATIARICGVALIFVLVRTANDIWIYAAIQAGMLFVGSALLIPSLHRYVRRPDLSKLHPLKDLKPALMLFIPTVATGIYLAMDRTMIGLITQSAAQNGYYEQAIKVARATPTLVSALSAVMMSRIGSHVAKGELSTAKEYLYKSYQITWLFMVPFCLGLIAVAPFFVPWFFGPEFAPSIPLLQVDSLLIPAVGIIIVTSYQYLIPMGKQNMLTITNFVGLGLNLVLNFVLISHFQAMGAAVSTIICEVFMMSLQLFLIRKDVSIARIIGCGAKYVAAGLIMFAVVVFAGRFMQPTVGDTLLLVVIGAVVYGAIVLVLELPTIRRLRSRS